MFLIFHFQFKKKQQRERASYIKIVYGMGNYIYCLFIKIVLLDYMSGVYNALATCNVYVMYEKRRVIRSNSFDIKA